MVYLLRLTINIYQNQPFMRVYIPVPWIRHGALSFHTSDDLMEVNLPNRRNQPEGYECSIRL